MLRLILVIIVTCGFVASSFAGTLQKLIDNAHEGATINLHKMIYRGGVVIKKTITLNCNGATIDAMGRGDVVVIKMAKNVVVENCILENSGSSGWRMDAGVKLLGVRGVRIVNNKIKNCLYGIVAKNAKGALIKGNEIESKPYSEGEKGDAIRLWWSGNSKVIKNYIHDSRDIVSIFSNDVIFDGNRVENSHIGTMVQNSDRNRILNFRGVDNEVGILINSSADANIKKFYIKDSRKYRGIVLVRASNTIIKDGKVENCSKGIVLNLSPAKRGTKNNIENVELVGNKIGIYLHTTMKQRSRNLFKSIKYVNNTTNLMDEWKTHE